MDIEVSETVEVLFSAVTVISSIPPLSVSSSSENKFVEIIRREPRRSNKDLFFMFFPLKIVFFILKKLFHKHYEILFQ